MFILLYVRAIYIKLKEVFEKLQQLHKILGPFS